MWGGNLKYCILMGFCIWATPSLWAQTPTVEKTFLKKAADFRQHSKYDSALFYYEKAMDRATAEQNNKEKVQALNGLGLVYIDLSKYTQAQSYLNESIKIGETHLSDHDSDIGEAYGRLAYSYSQEGKIEQAIENYLISLRIFQNGVGEISQLAANTYSNLGAAYYLLGKQSQKAIENLQKSIEINHKLGGKESLEMARAYNDLANVYFDLEDHEQAIDYHRLSLQIKQKIMDPMHPSLGVSNFNLARSFFALGDYQRAADHYLNTLEIDIATFGEEHRWVGEDYYSIADCYNVQGNHLVALKYAQRASDIMQLTYGADNHRTATTYNTLGQVYLNLDNYEQAIIHFQKALGAFDKNPIDTRDIPHGKALAQSQMGILSSLQGDYQRSIEHHQQSLNLHRSILSADHYLVARDFQNLAVGYTGLGQREKALNHYQTALEMMISSSGREHPQVARLYLDIGDFYLENQQTTKALEHYQTALQSMVPQLAMTNYPNPSLEQLSLLPITLDILNQKGWAFDTQYSTSGDPQDLKNAMKSYRLAMDLIDTLRVGFLEQGSKQSLQENHLQVYERSLAAAQKLFHLDGSTAHLATAFKVMEKSKAFLLLTSLRESTARSFANIPAALWQKEQDLKYNLAFCETKAQNEQDESKKLEWRQKAFLLNKTYDSLMMRISQDHPQYHQLKYNTSVIALSALQKSMSKDQMILQYFTGEKDLHALAVTSNDQMLYSVPFDRSMMRNVEVLRRYLTEKTPFDNAFSLASQELYKHLLAPAGDLMQNRTLTIIPDGILNYFPFEILSPSASGTESSYSDLDYLIFQHNINYAYSATLWNSMKDPPTSSRSVNYLAFAPQFNQREEQSDDFSSQLALTEIVRGNLSELKGTLREAGSIASFFNGQFLQGELATESQFKESAPAYEILHLATHAIVDDRFPMNSRLLFTASGDSVNDGDLHVWELYNMQLKAKMAVLSACNTGFGKLQRGEGVMSLGRAFAYAGCPSVIMSLWPAQDEATADIMELFYEGIAQGLSKDQALAQAKINYLNQANDLFAHPFYWAGFVVQGDTSPLKKSPPLLIWWMVGLLLAISLFFVFRRR